MNEDMDNAMIAGLIEDADADRALVKEWDETLPALHPERIQRQRTTEDGMNEEENVSPEQTDMDRGAMAALDLLARSMEFPVGEESYEENAETIRGAIAMDGLAAVIARQRDSEIDFIDEDDRDEFPEHLAALASDVPKTVWK